MGTLCGAPPNTSLHLTRLAGDKAWLVLVARLL